MISLDTVQSEFHSIQLKDAAGDALAIGADGSINITDNGGSLTVDGTVELGATTLAALENITATISGDVNVTQGTSPWVVSGTVELGATTLAALESITVTATNLDIRDLSHASDSIKIGDGTDFLAINGDGSINAQFTESGYASWTVVAASVTTTESTVSALSGRIRVEIQNLGSSDVYIRQSTGVSASNGLKIPKGSSFEQSLDAGAAIFMVTGSGSSDVRIAQYAA